MNLRDILRTKGADVVTIRQDTSLLEAARELREHNIGVLLVMDGAEHPAGIISERDVVSLLAERGSIDGLTVQDAMSRELIVCVPTDSVDYAMQVMTQKRIRHLPVMDGERLAGLVSIGDLVKSHISQAETEIRYLHSYIQGVRT